MTVWTQQPRLAARQSAGLLSHPRTLGARTWPGRLQKRCMLRGREHEEAGALLTRQGSEDSPQAGPLRGQGSGGS